MNNRYYRLTYHFRNTDECFRTAKEARECVSALEKQYRMSGIMDSPWGYRIVVKKVKGE